MKSILQCRDPLLDIQCSFDIASCLNPYECHSFGSCLPVVSGIGISPVSVYDLIIHINAIEMAWHNASWHGHQHVPPYNSEP